jgi:rubrerythrin
MHGMQDRLSTGKSACATQKVRLMHMKEKAVENLEELTATLRSWQQIEDATVKHTTQVMERTQNPLIRLVMEIIRQDSVMHKKVQQVILDSLEKQAFTLTPEELGEIWEMLEKHLQMEKETIALAEKGRDNCRLFVQRNLLTYLAEDEQKHVRLLGQLEDFKRSIYPYA